METKDKKAKVCVVAERLAFLVGRRVTVFNRSRGASDLGYSRVERGGRSGMRGDAHELFRIRKI